MNDANDHRDADTEPDGDATDVAALEADIERTREALAQTVDQLAAKLDVKTRVRHRVAETKDLATERAQDLRDAATDDRGRPTPAAMAAAGGLLVALAAIVLLAGRRARRTGGRRR